MFKRSLSALAAAAMTVGTVAFSSAPAYAAAAATANLDLPAHAECDRPSDRRR